VLLPSCPNPLEILHKPVVCIGAKNCAGHVVSAQAGRYGRTADPRIEGTSAMTGNVDEMSFEDALRELEHRRRAFARRDT